MAKRGRPSAYSPDIAKRICATMADGNTLSKVCRQSWAPSRSTVLQWASNNPEFKAELRQARIDGAYAMADMLFDIADEMPKDNAQASRQREKIKVYMWSLSKIVPTEFGDRMQLDVHSHGDPREAERRASERISKADARLARETRAGVLRDLYLSLPEGAVRDEIRRKYPDITRFMVQVPIESTAVLIASEPAGQNSSIFSEGE